MAPERLDGVNDSASVDVYSAGMTLFELLTGRPMSLSINPVSHDQAMNRQLQYVHIQGMSTAAVEDLRDLIRRMCAYTRDYRPSAADCARDLEQLQYAMDRRYHIPLDEFARTTVLPIYESRQRVKPEDALPEEDSVILEHTGHLTETVSRVPQQRLALAPYVFVSVLGFVVVLLGALALIKQFSPDTTDSDGLVRVEVWIPDTAYAQLGETFLRSKGAAKIPPGTTVLELMFSNGKYLNCPLMQRKVPLCAG